MVYFSVNVYSSQSGYMDLWRYACHRSLFPANLISQHSIFHRCSRPGCNVNHENDVGELAASAADDYEAGDYLSEEDETALLGGEGFSPEQLAEAEKRFQDQMVQCLSFLPLNDPSNYGQLELPYGQFSVEIVTCQIYCTFHRNHLLCRKLVASVKHLLHCMVFICRV